MVSGDVEKIVSGLSSVSGLFLGHPIIKSWIAGNLVFFFCPATKINQLAAFAAEGPVLALRLPFDLFCTGWAWNRFCHGLSLGKGPFSAI